MSKNFLFGIIIFLVLPVHAMNSSQALSSGLQDIVRNKLQPLLSLQEIARFKRSCKLWNVLGDVERFCPLSHRFQCSTNHCARLAKNYYTCGRALAHFAYKAKENAQNKDECEKDEKMFRHLWIHHALVRDEDVAKILKVSVIGVKEQMEVYRKNYNDGKKLRKHILEYAARAICGDSGDIETFKTVLLGNSFSIFDLLSMKTETCQFYYDEDYLFLKACQLNNVAVIRLLCGGTIDARSLEYVMEYASVNLLLNLMYTEILPVDATDWKKKSVLHYLAEQGYDSAIELAVQKGAYVNDIDAKGMTPLHYAAKNIKLGAVQQLLSYEDADVRFADKKGKKPIDYTSTYAIPVLNWNPNLNPEELRDSKAIKKELKKHAEQHKVEAYSHAKVHKNGYHKLQ